MSLNVAINTVVVIITGILLWSFTAYAATFLYLWGNSRALRYLNQKRMERGKHPITKSQCLWWGLGCSVFTGMSIVTLVEIVK